MDSSSIDTAYFRIGACRDCLVPGYLIISALRPEGSLAELSPAAQRELGPVLGACVEAITKVLRPERVYTAHFSELSPGVHFHLFPRTREVLAAFQASHPHDQGIDGPKLLSWARASYRCNSPSATPLASLQILELLRSMQILPAN